MDELGLTSSDVVQITGKRKTKALSWPAYPEDYGKGTLHIDGYMRNNAGVSKINPISSKELRMYERFAQQFSKSKPSLVTRKNG